MFRNVFSGYIISDFADENLIIPFTSIVVAIFIGFALLPIALKYIKGSRRKVITIMFTFSALIFIGSSLFIENIALKQWELIQHSTEIKNSTSNWEAFPFNNEEHTFEINGEYFKSRSVQMTRSGAVIYYLDDGREIVRHPFGDEFFIWDTNTPAYLVDEFMESDYMHDIMADIRYITILPVVKIHYYIFSIILILIILSFLYNFSILFTENAGEMNKPRLITQGLAGIIYLSTILFVKEIKYINFDINYISPESTISVLSCIIMAAIASGLLVDNLLNGKTGMRLIPPFISSFVVIILYATEYFMLGGGFYRYDESFFFKPLILMGISAANVIVILLPGIIVFFIIKITTVVSAGKQNNRQKDNF